MNFLLLPGPDGGLDGVLFDVRHMEEPLDDYVNVTLLIFKGLLLQIPHLHEIFNTFVLIFCRFVSHKNISVCLFHIIQKYFYVRRTYKQWVQMCWIFHVNVLSAVEGLQKWGKWHWHNHQEAPPYAQHQIKRHQVHHLVLVVKKITTWRKIWWWITCR